MNKTYEQKPFMANSISVDVKRPFIPDQSHNHTSSNHLDINDITPPNNALRNKLNPSISMTPPNLGFGKLAGGYNFRKKSNGVKTLLDVTGNNYGSYKKISDTPNYYHAQAKSMIFELDNNNNRNLADMNQLNPIKVKGHESFQIKSTKEISMGKLYERRHSTNNIFMNPKSSNSQGLGNDMFDGNGNSNSEIRVMERKSKLDNTLKKMGKICELGGDKRH